MALFFALASCAGPATNQPNTVMQTTPLPAGGTDTATFGTGCFWCTEAIFQQLEGVIKVSSGYSGGYTENPDYKEVCSGTTGHAECLQIVFDPAKISFDELLEVFWQTHDPTTLNRQGNDVGTQYRSTIFYTTETQLQTARAVIDSVNQSGFWKAPIVTTLEAFSKWWPAEANHQDYLQRYPNGYTCHFMR